MPGEDGKQETLHQGLSQLGTQADWKLHGELQLACPVHLLVLPLSIWLFLLPQLDAVTVDNVP